MPPPDSFPDMYALNESDRVAFHQLVDWFKRRNLHPPPLSEPPPLLDGPWNTVVLTPLDGIPAMCNIASGYTGTGTKFNETCGTLAGTATGEEGDKPGSADCLEFFLEKNTPGDPGRVLNKPRLRLTGRTLTAYNLSNKPVAGNQFITLHQDKYGDWWVPWPGLLFKDC